MIIGKDIMSDVFYVFWPKGECTFGKEGSIFHYLENQTSKR